MITPCYTPAGGLTRLLSVLHSFPPASLISVPLRSHPLHHSSHAALTATWHASLFHHERFFTVLHVPPRYKIHILAAPDLRDGAARLRRDKESAAEFQFSAGASTRTRRTPGEGRRGGGGAVEAIPRRCFFRGLGQRRRGAASSRTRALPDVVTHPSTTHRHCSAHRHRPLFDQRSQPTRPASRAYPRWATHYIDLHTRWRCAI